MSDLSATTTVPTPGYWVHDLNPFLFRFPESWHWQVQGLRWYGISYVLGFLVGMLLLHFYYKRGKSPLNADKQSVLICVIIAGVLLGGRIGYIIGYMWPRYEHYHGGTRGFFNFLSDHWRELIRVWEGGMASHGGMIGVWIALGWFAWHYRLRFFNLMDIVVTLAPAGIFFGRIANFINGELPGRETHVPWAVIFRVNEFGRTYFLLPRHPSQLYAAVLEGLLLLAWTQWRFWKCKLPEGQLVGEAMIGYAAVRIIGEIWREPDAGVGLVAGLSRGQFYSIFLGLIGVGVILWARRNIKNLPKKAV